MGYADAMLILAAQKDEQARRIGFSRGMIQEALGYLGDPDVPMGKPEAYWACKALKQALAMLDKGEILL